MNELDLTKRIDFEVVGDIKPTIIKILGDYKTYMSSDCDVHLCGTNAISVPAYYPYLSYYGSWANDTSKQIIQELYNQNLIKIHEICD